MAIIEDDWDIIEEKRTVVFTECYHLRLISYSFVGDGGRMEPVLFVMAQQIILQKSSLAGKL